MAYNMTAIIIGEGILLVLFTHDRKTFRAGTLSTLPFKASNVVIVILSKIGMFVLSH